MTPAIRFVEGPLFRVAFLLMTLGLLRLIVLGVRGAVLRTVPADPRFSRFRDAALGWLVPLRTSHSYLRAHGLLNVLMHVGVIAVPVFLTDHILLWSGALGFGLPAMSHGLIDTLTFVTLASLMGIIAIRLVHPASRKGSDPVDHVILSLLGLSFLSGYLASHPEMSPFMWETTLVIHVLCAEAVLVLIPFTRLAHFVLSPTRRILAARHGTAFPESVRRPQEVRS